MTQELPPAGPEPPPEPATRPVAGGARATGPASALGRAFRRRPLVLGAVAAAGLALLAGLALSSGTPGASVAADKPGVPFRDPDAGLQVVAGAPPEAKGDLPPASRPTEPAPPAVRAEAGRGEAGDDALAEADRYERAQRAGEYVEEPDAPPPRPAPRAHPDRERERAFAGSDPGDQTDPGDAEDDEEPRPPPPPPPSGDR